MIPTTMIGSTIFSAEQGRINILRRIIQPYIGAYEPVLAECYG